LSEIFSIGRIREALERHMDRRNLRGKPLSKAAGLNENAVRDLMNKVDDPRIGTLLALAHALQVSPSTLLGDVVQVAGHISNNGEILPWSDEFGEPLIVPRPTDINGELVAYKVTGTGLAPSYLHGDIVYCCRDHDDPIDEYLEDDCVMQLAGSGALIFKTLTRGSQPGRYTLRGHNAAPLEDMQVAWAAPVLVVRRKRANGHAQ